MSDAIPAETASPETAQLLDGFFAAIERGDLEGIAACYAPDVQVWHNVTGSALDKAGSLDLLRFWTSKVTDMRYEVLERQTFPGGAVQRHIVHGRAGVEGVEIHAEICIVFHVVHAGEVGNSQITHIFEYLDPAAVSAVFGTS